MIELFFIFAFLFWMFQIISEHNKQIEEEKRINKACDDTEYERLLFYYNCFNKEKKEKNDKGKRN